MDSINFMFLYNIDKMFYVHERRCRREFDHVGRPCGMGCISRDIDGVGLDIEFTGG